MQILHRRWQLALRDSTPGSVFLCKCKHKQKKKTLNLNNVQSSKKHFIFFYLLQDMFYISYFALQFNFFNIYNLINCILFFNLSDVSVIYINFQLTRELIKKDIRLLTRKRLWWWNWNTTSANNNFSFYTGSRLIKIEKKFSLQALKTLLKKVAVSFTLMTHCPVNANLYTYLFLHECESDWPHRLRFTLLMNHLNRVFFTQVVQNIFFFRKHQCQWFD